MNKATWKRNPRTNKLEAYFMEDGKNWVSYKQSKLYIPEISSQNNPSFPTFQQAVKSGYEIVKSEN
jgi:hypothetical protein